MKTQDEINEANKLIAMFLGAVYVYRENYSNKHWVKLSGNKHYNRLHELHYHTSWDWLMPVVQKINNMTPEIKMPRDLESLRNGSHSADKYLSVCIHPICCPIELIYSEVVEFIKWYNTQQ